MKAGLGRKYLEQQEPTTQSVVPLQNMSDLFEQSSALDLRDTQVETERNYSRQHEPSSSQAVPLQNALTRPDQIPGQFLQGDVNMDINNGFQFHGTSPQLMSSFLHGDMNSSVISRAIQSFSGNQLASGQSLLPVLSQGQLLQAETVRNDQAQSVMPSFDHPGNMNMENMAGGLSFTSTNHERRHTWNICGASSNLDSLESTQEPDSPEQELTRKRQRSNSS